MTAQNFSLDVGLYYRLDNLTLSIRDQQWSWQLLARRRLLTFSIITRCLGQGVDFHKMEKEPLRSYWGVLKELGIFSVII